MPVRVQRPAGPRRAWQAGVGTQEQLEDAPVYPPCSVRSEHPLGARGAGVRGRAGEGGAALGRRSQGRESERAAAPGSRRQEARDAGCGAQVGGGTTEDPPQRRAPASRHAPAAGPRPAPPLRPLRRLSPSTVWLESRGPTKLFS